MPTHISALFYRQRRGANADIAGCRGDKLYGAAERSIEPATEKSPKKPSRFGQKVSFLHSVALFYFEHRWQSRGLYAELGGEAKGLHGTWQLGTRYHRIRQNLVAFLYKHLPFHR